MKTFTYIWAILSFFLIIGVCIDLFHIRLTMLDQQAKLCEMIRFKRHMDHYHLMKDGARWFNCTTRPSVEMKEAMEAAIKYDN